jgi:hypothetical protein
MIPACRNDFCKTTFRRKNNSLARNISDGTHLPAALKLFWNVSNIDHLVSP